jgi:hypothetical protein
MTVAASSTTCNSDTACQSAFTSGLFSLVNGVIVINHSYTVPTKTTLGITVTLPGAASATAISFDIYM